jgi:putative flippase GtrA
VLTPADWIDHFRRRFGLFAVLSGLGFVCDFVTYTTLAACGVRLFQANLAGAAVGMGTVFAGSRLALFRGGRTALPVATGLYMAWSAVAIVTASALIDGLGGLLRAPAPLGLLSAALAALPIHVPVKLAISTIAKAVVTPLTILSNFCAMTVINGHRITPSAAPRDTDPPAGVRADVQLRRADRPGGCTD